MRSSLPRRHTSVQFEFAASPGKHVYMEKPVAVDTAGRRRMLAAAMKADTAKIVSVGFQQRYGKDYLKGGWLSRSARVVCARRLAERGMPRPRETNEADSHNSIRLPESYERNSIRPRILLS